MLLFFKSVFFVQVRRLKISAAVYSSPFSFKMLSLQHNTGKYTVKRSLHKRADFPFSSHDHAEYTGHYPADGNCLMPAVQIIGNTVPITKRQYSGKINSHEIVFLCTKIRRICQIVIGRKFFCFADTAQDFFFCLGIDPDTPLILIFYTCHLSHKAVDILSFTPGVGTHIDGLYIRTVQKPLNNVKLFLNSRNHFIFKFTRQKRQGI